MARRSHGEGSIFPVGDRWQAVLPRVNAAGTRRPRQKKIFDRKADAVAWLRRKLTETATRRSGQTVAGYMQAWMADHVAVNCSDGTHSSYGYTVKNHIVPRLGTVKLSELTPLILRGWLADLDRAKIGGAAKRYAFRVLRTALNQAVKLGELSVNPCLAVDSPKHKRKEVLPFTEDEVREIVRESAGTHYGALWALLLGCGPRIAEATGLHWADVDFAAGTIRVKQQFKTVPKRPVAMAPPKTESSIRTINLPAPVLTALNDHRVRLLAAGKLKPWVFPTKRGTPSRINPLYVHWWYPLLDQLGIPRRSLHQCRHTYATLSLRAGVPVHIVSKVLGHANAAMTLREYAHVIQADQTQATSAIERIFGT